MKKQNYPHQSLLPREKHFHEKVFDYLIERPGLIIIAIWVECDIYGTLQIATRS